MQKGLKYNFNYIIILFLLTWACSPFYFAGITSIHKLSFYAFSLIPTFFAMYKGIKSNYYLTFFSELFFFYLTYVILVMVITVSLDFQYLIYFFRILINFFAVLSCVFIFIAFKKKYKFNFNFSKLFLDSVCFYILGTCAFILCPPLKNLWTSMLADLGKRDFSDFLEYVTRFGFAGFSGFGTAFLVCVATVIAVYLYLNNGISLKQMKCYSVLLLLGSFFYGRIGLVVTFFSLGILSLYLLFHKKSKLFKFYLSLLSMLILTIILVYFCIPNTQIFFEWLLEPIFNLFQNGEFKSASTDGLFRFYENFHPSNRTLLLGDGYWFDLNGNGYYGHTDVGFMRNIYYGGFFYTFVLYCLPLLFILIFYLYMKNNDKKGCGFVSFLLLFQLLMFEIKGDIAFSFLKLYLPIYFSFLYEKNNRRLGVRV